MDLGRLPSARAVLLGGLAAAVLYLCFLSRLDAIGLIGPDEPRYASVAREMAQSGDWVTPRLNGKPWFEKPILYYWAAGASFRVWGVSEFSARLPSAVAATLATLALGWVACRFYGFATAGAVLLMVPTSIGVLGFGRAATPDMLFSAALTGAMIAASQLLRGGSRPLPPVAAHTAPICRGLSWRITFGAFLGAAALAKGPAALILAAGSVLLWAAMRGRWRAAVRLADPFAGISFCVVALPWYVLCGLRNPGFFGTFLFFHNIGRYLTPVFRHRQPIWFYAPIVLLGLLPWTVLLICVVREAWRFALRWREKRQEESFGAFAACWAVLPVLFFSFSQSKLPGYILPGILPLVFVLARSLVRAIEERNSLHRWPIAGVGAAFLVVALTNGYWLDRLPAGVVLRDQHFALVCIGVIGAVGAAIVALGLLRRPWAALVVTAIAVAGLAEGANMRILPVLDSQVSSRAAARIARDSARSGELVQVYRLRREWHYGLNFYLGRELPEWTSGAGHPARIITNRAGLAELERQGLPFVVLADVAQEAVLVRVE